MLGTHGYASGTIPVYGYPVWFTGVAAVILKIGGQADTLRVFEGATSRSFVGEMERETESAVVRSFESETEDDDVGSRN